MQISTTKLQVAANTLNNIDALTQTMTVNDFIEIRDINMWPNVLNRLKSLTNKSTNSKAVNLRDELNVLSFTHGFTQEEVIFITETAIEKAIENLPAHDQFTIGALNPMFRI
ncbi:hypothetical protein [Aeromonas veronii]|uniref:hypothetical protein n=1 Tax=Aeromonas veronii TaxID=654 RepID=UPI003BA0D3FC